MRCRCVVDALSMRCRCVVDALSCRCFCRCLPARVAPFPVRAQEIAPPRRGSAHRRSADLSGSGEVRAGIERFARVPFFVLVGKLEEMGQGLRLQRDEAREEVARNQVEIANLEEQLATAKAHLQQKNATIDKMMREHTALADEMAAAKAITAKEEKRYEVLQAETVLLTRDFLKSTQRLEEQIDELRFENTQLQSAALERGFKQQEIDALGALSTE